MRSHQAGGLSYWGYLCKQHRRTPAPRMCSTGPHQCCSIKADVEPSPVELSWGPGFPQEPELESAPGAPLSLAGDLGIPWPQSPRPLVVQAGAPSWLSSVGHVQRSPWSWLQPRCGIPGSIAMAHALVALT